MPTEPTRIARRRAATRDRILDVAARRFAASGPDGVRLEEIADEADVARGTLYSHFPTKDGLVQEVLRPALQRAMDEARDLKDLGAVESVELLLRLYLELWRDHRDSIRLAYRMTPGSLGTLSGLHEEFLRTVWSSFTPAAELGLLRSGDPVLSARVLSRLAIPMLEILSGKPGGEALFVDSMRGLLLREPKE